MPCNATSQLTNAPSVPLPVTMPTNNAQWAVFVQRLQDIINAISQAANRQPVNVVPIAYAVYNGSSLPAFTVTGATTALDTTKAQFGKASLQLTATASTVTLAFPVATIVMQPNARWIESVFIQSSRTSISGTLAVVTPTKGYPVNISGMLLPSTWGRIYGDCDLTADDSTSCYLQLTLTGCSVGDTFNLEGWQLEQSAGTSLPSPFVLSAAPSDYVNTVATANNANTAAETAINDANAALAQVEANEAQIATISDDGILTPAEKGSIISDYNVIIAEQPSLDSQGTLFGVPTQQAAYDSAISALTSYLATLTTPTKWNDLSGNTNLT